MGLASEYFDDGSSFISISPLSINPEFLTDFALFERYPTNKDGQFRYRCLLMDTRSIETTRLKALIEKWETIYIHKKDAKSYNTYTRKNLEYILTHGDISVEQKTETLVTLSSEVIEEAFAVNFSSHADMANLINDVEELVASALSFLSDIKSLKGMVDLINHDYNTHTHSIKVGWLIAVFIKANSDLFDLAETSLKELMMEATVAGFLHDLGKIKIPKKVLNKPGRLDNIENSLIQCHPAYALSLFFDSSLSHRAAQAVLYHHENEDGSGYPCGLPGDDIPLLAKICHIADVFDALTSERSYKKAKTPFDALKLMVGENPYLDKLKKFEAEASVLAKPPLTTIVRDDYNAKLRHLRELEMLQEEGAKRVEVRMKLRDQGMSHCFDRELLKRFILTLNKSESFDLSEIL